MRGEGVDIGHGVTILRVKRDDGTEVGILETHPGPSGQPCYGFVYFEGLAPLKSYPTWRVVQDDPLTLEPSIQCNTCGHHGFIREGKWVPAPQGQPRT